jgi:hypothetical protein
MKDFRGKIAAGDDGDFASKVLHPFRSFLSLRFSRAIIGRKPQGTALRRSGYGNGLCVDARQAPFHRAAKQEGTSVLKRILSGLGIGNKPTAPAPPPPLAGPAQIAPYKDGALNHLYNLLFCDDWKLFNAATASREAPWTVLLAPDPDPGALAAIAEDASQESRVRLLAYNRLRERGLPVAAKILLGVVVEVSLENGLDVLAAFADNRVRYINQAEKMSVFEQSPPEVVAKVAPLLAASRAVVDQIGPWGKPRLEPPRNGMMRTSFLVSDGLYFGQGQMEELERDQLGAPVVAASVSLLRAVVDAAVTK